MSTRWGLARYAWAILFASGLDIIAKWDGWEWLGIACAVAGLAGFVDNAVKSRERAR